MSKTQLTIDIEEALYLYSSEQGEVVVEEVSIPDDWGRVDTLACRYKQDGCYEWRCYEVKVSQSDFRSTAKISFVGDYNYYVMPQLLYEKVQNQIPAHVGVMSYLPFEEAIMINEQLVKGSLTIVKKASKQELLVNPHQLMYSFLHSLFREVRKAKRMEKGLHLFGDQELYKELLRRYQGSGNHSRKSERLLDTFVKEKEMQERSLLLDELVLTRQAYKTLLSEKKEARRVTEAIL